MKPSLTRLIEAARLEQGWTETRVAALTELWTLGYSASQVVAQIGGASRNAVVGKTHRLGIVRSPEARAITTAAGRINWRRPKQRTLKVGGNRQVFEACAPGPQAKALPEHPGGLRIIDPGFGGCRWPIGGTGADTRFCCESKAEGGSYCATHMKRAHQVRSPSQKAADEARAAKARAGKRRAA